MLVGVNKCDNTPCACHRLSAVIETGWKNACQTDPKIEALNVSTSKLITSLNHKLDIYRKLVKKIKESGQKRAWKGLYDKMRRILVNYEKLV